MLTEVVNYEYYYKTYGGSSIPEPSFKKLSIEATNKVNYYTRNRITTDIIDDNIRNTTCEIIELIYSQNILKEKIINNDKEKASETVGPHSVSYINKSSIQEKHILSSDELNKECYKICCMHLVNTGLMYRGIN